MAPREARTLQPPECVVEGPPGQLGPHQGFKAPFKLLESSSSPQPPPPRPRPRHCLEGQQDQHGQKDRVT